MNIGINEDCFHINFETKLIPNRVFDSEWRVHIYISFHLKNAKLDDI